MADENIKDAAQNESSADSGKNILLQARKLLAEGKIEESLKLVKNYWLENPDDSEAADLFSDLMKETGRSELSKRLHLMAGQLPKSTGNSLNSPQFVPSKSQNIKDTLDFAKRKNQNPANSISISSNSSDQNATNENVSDKDLLEAGHGLIDARQHELAAMLLNRANRIAPQEPTVNYELGFALMSMKRFEQAIPHLEQALERLGDFDTLLNLLVCYTLTRQISKAHEMLVKINSLSLDAEQKREASHRVLVLKRLESMRNKAKLNARDWLYILYGSVLLRSSPQKEHIQEDAHSIGQSLAIMKGVLEGLSAMPEVVEFYGPQSRPLAQALAEFLEIPVSGYKGPEQPVQAILIMTWASDIIGPHKSFVQKEKNRSIFSYGLAWDEPLPVVPEIVCMMGHSEPMPWDENKADPNPKISSEPTIGKRVFAPEIEKTYKAIIAQARDLESDPRTIKAVQEALDYYENKRQHLPLCNPDAFSFRAEYTAEILD